MVILEVDLTGLEEYEIKAEKYEWEIIVSCIVEPKRLKLVEDYEPFFL